MWHECGAAEKHDELATSQSELHAILTVPAGGSISDGRNERQRGSGAGFFMRRARR
jgi:hypothetical protein